VSGDISIHIEGSFRGLIYDRREQKAALKKGGAVVRKEARRLIARRAVSAPGEFPGRDKGIMSKAIKVKPGSGGGYVKVMPYRIPEMGDRDDAFYPAFLMLGTHRGLRPRKDFMVAALDNKQAEIRQAIYEALRRAIHPI
jgi:hypothetical protein